MSKINFEILTLFPSFFASPLKTSLIGKAIDSSLIGIKLYQIRDWGKGKRKNIDDTPYGGGAGMVMRADVLAAATEALKAQSKPKAKVILFDPAGERLTQALAAKLANEKHLILVCGRYEGVDQRYKELYVDTEISIGDYIVNGGEVAALVFIETLSRLVGGVLGSENSTETESFSPQTAGLLLEYPQYTKPAVFQKKKVPAVLLKGNHQEIKSWRDRKALEKTKKQRPDLLQQN